MEFVNEHIGTAFALVSSLHVSGDAIDVIWAVRQQLILADKDIREKEGAENG